MFVNNRFTFMVSGCCEICLSMSISVSVSNVCQLMSFVTQMCKNQKGMGHKGRSIQLKSLE